MVVEQYVKTDSVGGNMTISFTTQYVLEDDLFIITQHQDGNRALDLTSIGFTELDDTFGSTAETQRIFYKVAAADDEQVSDFTLIDDDYVIGLTVLRGIKTTSFTGATVRNNGNNSTPTIPQLTTTAADSVILYVATADVDTISFISGVEQMYAEDPGAVSGACGIDYPRALGEVVQPDIKILLADTWKCVAIELLRDVASTVKPLRLNKNPYNDLGAYADNTDMRDAVYNSGQLIDKTRARYSFGMDSTDASGTTLTYGTGGLSSIDNRRVYKAVLLTGVMPGGMTDGNYYYLETLTDTTASIRIADVGEQYGQNTDISVSSNTGTYNLVEVGITINDNYNFRLVGGGGTNYIVMNRTYTSYDATAARIAAFVGTTTFPGFTGINFTLMDSDGDWKTWVMHNTTDYIDAIGEQSHEFDVTNTNHDTDKSYGTFDASKLIHAFIGYSCGGIDDRPTVTAIRDPYIVNTLVMTGTHAARDGVIVPATSGDVVPIAESLQGGILDARTPNVYTFAQSICYGDAAADTTIDDSTMTLVFPTLADGVTELQYYVDEFALCFNRSADDDINISSAQIKSDNAFGLTFEATDVDTATISSASASIIKANLEFQSAEISNTSFIDAPTNTLNDTSLVSCLFLDCAQIAQMTATLATCTFNNTDFLLTNAATFTGASFDACDIVLDQTFINANSAVTFTDISFANGGEINCTATTGSVTVTVSGGTTPTVTTAGATVTVVTPTLTLTIDSNVSLVGAEVRIYDFNGTGTSLGDELDGVESNGTATFATTDVSASNTVYIQVIQSGYVEFGQEFTMGTTSQTFTAQRIVETNT